MATIYFTDRTAKIISPANDYKFTLEEVQEIVGGYIEVIELNNGTTMFINEDGLLINLEYNSKATELVVKYSYNLFLDDEGIVGTVLVCNNNEIDF